MKTRTFVYLFFAVICSFVFFGFSGGPGFSGLNCTGAETGNSNLTGCSKPGGCHSSAATTLINVAIEVDSAGISTTHYTAGFTYSVKISGINNTMGNVLPKFGFQIGCIKGSTSAVTPIPTGTWNTPYPIGTRSSGPQPNFFVVPVLEHSSAQLATSGSGDKGTTYSRTFSWTAPASGSGFVSFFAAINAVNGNALADAGDMWNTAHLVISEWGTTGISSNVKQAFSVNVFPNPAFDHLNFEYNLMETGAVNIQVFDLSGKLVSNLLQERQHAGQQNLNLDLPADLSSGIYILRADLNGDQYLKKIVISR